MTWRFYSCLLVGLGILVSAGCGEEPYQLAPVSGVVIFDGEPLEGGLVRFKPIVEGDLATAGPESQGVTDEEGRFKLHTLEGAGGAVVGRHKVMIYSRNPSGPAQALGEQPVVELIPPRYNDRTQLDYVVPPAGTRDADFNLATDEG